MLNLIALELFIRIIRKNIFSLMKKLFNLIWTYIFIILAQSGDSE